MSFRANLALIAMAVWNVVVVKPFYALLRLLPSSWTRRPAGEGDDGQPG